MIVHFARKQEWEDAKESGQYKPSDFDDDGYIHCSSTNQAPDVANEKFAGEEDLVLLWIEPGRVNAGVIYERPPGEDLGPLWPHIHGALNTDAVIKTVNLKPFEKGAFVLPKEPPFPSA